MVLLDSAAGWLDAALVRRGLRPTAEPASSRLQRLEALAAHFAEDRHLAWPSGGFLTPGGPIAPAVVPRKPGIFDLAWPSGPGPTCPDDPNTTAWARVHRAGPAPGPVVLAIHGYGGGRQSAQRMMWPIRAWNRLGLDVVLPALPHHGPRAAPGQRRPPLEPDQPHVAQEAFRQAVHDVTGLIGWLRAQGYGPIGVVGKSLGGYTAALLATVEADLAFLALVMPLASIADGEVELVCASDGKLGRLWPDEGLPDGTCEGSVAFDVPVDLAAERVPPGQTGPFVAGVSVAGWWGGEIMATIPSGSPTGADDSQTGMAGVPAPILQTEPPT